MAKQLEDINSDLLGDFLEDYCNDRMNKQLHKFMVLDDPDNIEKILDKDGFEDVNDTDIRVGIAVAEATLRQVNKVLKAQGVEFAFKRFDAVDYKCYMLVNPHDNEMGTATRVKAFPLKKKDRPLVS